MPEANAVIQQKKGEKYKRPARTGQEAWAVKRERGYQPRNSKQQKLERIEEARSADEQSKKNIAWSAKVQSEKNAREQAHMEYVSGSRDNTPYLTHFASGGMKGQEITYDRWKQQVKLGLSFEPANVGEKSWQHVAESILFSDAWIPKDIPLSEENFPAYFVHLDGHENEWKPLLNRIDQLDDPALKQRANFIHNILQQTDTKQYLHRFHPQQNMTNNEIAKDLAGTHEQLSDDWSQPFKPHMNSVMFNHQLHSQIDVGIQETY